MDLPADWFVEHDGQRLVLDSEKVAAEIERLRADRDRLRKAIGDYLTSGDDRSAILALQRAYEQKGSTE